MGAFGLVAVVGCLPVRPTGSLRVLFASASVEPDILRSVDAGWWGALGLVEFAGDELLWRPCADVAA